MNRRLLILIGIAFLLAARLGYLDYSSLGFPDGYLSEFELETQNARFAALIANTVLGLAACVCGFGWRKAPTAIVLILVAAFLLMAVPSAMLPSCPEMQSCTSIYETITGHPLNHGIGG